MCLGRARRLVVRPGPAAAHRRCSLAPPPFALRVAACCPTGVPGALHGCVAAKEPRFRLLIGGIALLREALHCLVASALLAYLVHRFLKQHIPAHAHGYADRLLLHR